MTDHRPSRGRKATGPKRSVPASANQPHAQKPGAHGGTSEAKEASEQTSPLKSASTPVNNLVIPTELAGKTVLAVLRVMCPGQSWSQLRTPLQKGFVTLNGLICIDEARRVITGDVLLLSERPAPLPPQVTDLRIQFVDPHVVVVEKPSGMMTHRRPEERNWSAERKARQPALDEALNELLNRRAATGGSRRGTRGRTNLVRCVHRLDRDTSGLLVFARSEEAEKSLVSQFRRHAVHRVYWAIVHGTPDDGTLISNLVRDRGDGRRGSVTNPSVGQRAVTHVRLLEPLGDYSLIECRLETGRTNQIRIHMAESGHLVCGDPKYNQPMGSTAITDTSQAPRLALHAAELGFIHPVSGEELYFRMPFPPDLEQFADQLRSLSPKRIRRR